MSYTFAFSQCFVDIYPQEGGQYTLTGAQLLACTTDKSFDSGTFTIVLPPGGPKGPNQPPSWSEIVTPMSFVVIGMSRDVNQAIPMVGVVRTISENQEWRTGSGVRRVTVITGMDFTYFFAMFTYYSLWYLGATGMGVSMFGNNNPADALPGVLGAGLLSGDPATVGNNWFNQIMAGSTGVLANTFVQYQGQQVTFPTLMGTLFEGYDVAIPYGDYFVGSEGAWIEKFKLIFPFPFYEFFITTTSSVDNVANGTFSSATNLSNGNPVTSTGLGPNVSAFPCVVARINPVPMLTSSSTVGNSGPAVTNPNAVSFAGNSSAGNGTFDGIDASLWNALQLFQPEGTPGGFINSQCVFDESEVYNFFVLNPTWMRTLFGAQNNSVIPYIFQFSAAGDASSIGRYGFRPANGSFSWMTDITGDQAVAKKISNIGDLATQLLGRFAGYWEPTPLMAKASTSLWLRPDIMIGNRYRYAPFKNDATWDFYINRVTHSYVFGAPSTTTLGLARGLPTSVYSDTGNSGMLFNVHIGNAQRKDGVYTAGVPNGLSTLQALSLADFQTFLSNIGNVYITPQS